MPDSIETKLSAVRRRFEELLASKAQRTWVEIDHGSYGVSRAEAKECLDGDLLNRKRCALYKLLFESHPELRAIIYPGKWAAEPNPWAESIPRLIAALQSGKSRLRKITVVSSGDWDGAPSNEMSESAWQERNQAFAKNAAERLGNVLSQAA